MKKNDIKSIYLKTELLKFNPIKDKFKIMFNHYIMSAAITRNAENYKNENLEIGFFKFFINDFSRDLGVSITTIRRTIDLFMNLGIVTRVQRGNKGQPTIYKYHCIIEYKNKEGV